GLSMRSKLYDPNSWTNSQVYGRRLRERDNVDGIVFNSVRNPGGQCVAAFRPARIRRCQVLHHLEYRFSNGALLSVIPLGEQERRFAPA
ncbi:MAG: RES family NAD+ phosphorylase, partial [Candidatus Baltobacteraceae bacterium]